MITYSQNMLHINRIVPTNDIINLVNEGIAYAITPHGDYIPWEIENEFRLFHFYIASLGKDASVLAKYLKNYKGTIHSYAVHGDMYTPRWTLPICYFGKQYACCFEGTNGLDVGCLVNKTPVSYEGSDTNSNNYPNYLLIDTCLPHYIYYKGFGCNMHGIDIQLARQEHECCYYGDLRSLPFDNSTVDYFTIAMIIGPGNPMNTFIDMTLCLIELIRTLNNGGLIYIADFIVNTSFILACYCCGFRIFTNSDVHNGLPIGIFLTPVGSPLQKSPFSPIFSALFENELKINSTTEKIKNRTLLSNLYTPQSVCNHTRCECH